MIASWLLLGAPAQAADCPARHTTAALAAGVEEALAAWSTTDHVGFEAAADRALAMVDCLSEPATPQVAAALHRVGGMRLLVGGNEDLARRSFVAAIALEPEHQLPMSVAPKGSPLDQVWTQALTFSRPERTPLPLAGMNTRVDGTVGSDRPYAGPYVLQIESNGRIAYSDYLVDGAPAVPAGVRSLVATEKAMALPVRDPSKVVVAVPRSTSGASAPASVSSSKSGGGGGGKGLLWAGVASGGLAAGLYGTAAVTRLQYDRSPTGTTHTLTNGAYFSSIGTAALSGVLISTFIATR